MNKQSKKYWRSLDELEKTPEFQKWVDHEFPEGIADSDDSVSRRKFLTIMGASMALAGLSACRRPVEKLVPYVNAPEASLVPGMPQYYATTMPMGLDSYPLLVRSNEGRPTKIEGNKEHPMSNGATNAIVQASILNLYDPDRLKTPLSSGRESNWREFIEFWREKQVEYSENEGEGLALLTNPFLSPSMKRMLDEFLLAYPKATIVAYEPYGTENVVEGMRIATGKSLVPVYQYDKAQVIVSLDADIFMHTEYMDVRAAKGFADGRRLQSEKEKMNRLYVIEGGFTSTGATADHRLRVPSSLIGAFTLTLARELRSKGILVASLDKVDSYREHSFDSRFISSVADDLIRWRGQSVVVAGQSQPPIVHALVAAINVALQNVEKTISYKPLSDALVSSASLFSKLIGKAKEGSISTLVVLGGNPVYNSPADLDVASAIKNVDTVIRLGDYNDETSKIATWALPQTHYLESWGDVRSLDGTMSIIQPLIAPIYDSKSALEVFNLITTGYDEGSYDIVQNTWLEKITESFEKQWRSTLHDGFLKDSSVPGIIFTIQDDIIAEHLSKKPFLEEAPSESNFELVFRPSMSVYDGRYANNGWLQELPDPMTKITWGNAAVMSVKTAKMLGLRTKFSLSDVMKRQQVEISIDGKKTRLPVWILPGHSDYSITLNMGYGREGIGRVANKVGIDVFPLMVSSSPFTRMGAEVKLYQGLDLVATTQNHGSMEGRPLVVEADLEEYRKRPSFASEAQETARLLEKNNVPNKSLWNEVYDYSVGNQWGMVIDLNVCTGCNACAIACQSENNIPIVGKEQTSKGRHMHWIRIDRYFTGTMDEPEAVMQPVACQHCENAPCEQVCPVAATIHTEDGLNSMVYNRCVGTRYCANNCPYKVRRFNFFNYANDNPVYGDMPEEMKMVQNPEVTVRFRGVMEKCTYCVQRISHSRIQRKNKGEELKDGDVVTACQQVCPTEAITFGDINDKKSAVSVKKSMNRNYEILSELNVKPRTSYLGKVRNTNSSIKKITS